MRVVGLKTRLLALWLLVLAPLQAPGAPADLAAAREALATGEYAAAVAGYDGVLAATPGRTDAFLGRGEAWLALGDADRARADLEAGLAAAEASGETQAALQARLMLGRLHLRSGEPGWAEPLLRQVAEQGAGEHPSIAAAAENQLGNLLLLRGEPEAAAAAFDQALALAGTEGDSALRTVIQLNRARLGDAQALKSALELAEGLADDYPGLRVKLLAGERARQLKEYPAAERLLQRVVEQAGEWPVLRAQGRQGLAGVAAARGRETEALALLDRALADLGEAPEPVLRLGLERERGRLLVASRPEQAVAAWRRAVTYLEAVRSDLPLTNAEGESLFQTTLDPLYRGLADLLLRQSATADDDALRQALLREAREMIERLRAAELQDYFKSFCAVTRRPLSDLPPRTALLYPIVLPDRLELLLGLGSRLERRQVAVAAPELERVVRRLARSLRPSPGAPLRSFAADAARQLHRWLVEPFRGELESAQVSTLVFVPDGILRTLPLAALWDGERFLAQRMAAVTVPGLTLLDSVPLVRSETRALLAGLSEPGPVVGELPGWMAQAYLGEMLEDARRGPATRQLLRAEGGIVTREVLRDPQVRAYLQESLALPGVRAEIEALAGQMQGVRLEDRAMSLEALGEALKKPFEIVHIASHGYFSGDPELSFLLTHDHLLTMNRLSSLLQARGYEASPLELLTLSACQTAEGDDRSPLGLTGVALQSGARGALGSLWPVSDEATQRLLTAFYTHLMKPGVSKAQALQRAQQELMEQPEYRHPFFWSAFILVGNWL